MNGTITVTMTRTEGLALLNASAHDEEESVALGWLQERAARLMDTELQKALTEAFADQLTEESKGGG
jgi:hypothetical protein